LHIPKVVQHVRDAVICDNTERLALEFDPERPLRSTGDMPAWHTSRPCHPTERSQINFCVFDSGWEATEAFALERDPQVAAWAKNDHLGFEVIYSFGRWTEAVSRHPKDLAAVLAAAAH